MTALKTWVSASRPKTLPAALTPVVIGTLLAIADGRAHVSSALLAALGALLIQIGTNLANDYYDFAKGADTDARVGPTRVTSAGHLSPSEVRRAFWVVFAVAVVAGVPLILRGGWPILAVGLTGILAGVLYTAGPRPLGYLGLGDVFVFVFFGPVAVAGTHYVQALELSPAALVAGIGPGFLATALLVVNNLRDAETDRAAGKRTLAVRFGSGFARSEYIACIAGALATPILLILWFDAPVGLWIASAACLVAVDGIRDVLTARAGDPLIRSFHATGRLLSLYAAAFAIGWLL